MMMSRLASGAALLLALASTASPADAQRRRAPAHRAAPARPVVTAVDWLQRVERTAEGGYRMGNPNAAVKVVEYGSITCSHCAHFAAEANQPLRSRIRTGRVSFEYRPFMIFATDPGIFLLLGCQSPASFFAATDKLYAEQAEWTARAEAQESQLSSLGERERVAAVVRASGVDQLFRQSGMSQQRIDACLSDQAAMSRMAEAQRRAEALGVQGTPTFMINGRMVDAGNWAGLERLLR
jgi:protein-disulfide isomerase